MALALDAVGAVSNYGFASFESRLSNQLLAVTLSASEGALQYGAANSAACVKFATAGFPFSGADVLVSPYPLSRPPLFARTYPWTGFCDGRNSASFHQSKKIRTPAANAAGGKGRKEKGAVAMSNSSTIASIRQDSRFHELVSRRARLSWTMFAVVLAAYAALMGTVAFAPNVLRRPIADGSMINVGMMAAVAVFAIGLLLTWLYVRLANTTLDDINDEILHEASK
ncbi:MAG TPA: DUF485 domain-containing protein [Rhodoblastus sp.]|nr:DUF485 domain-containing protein [Rhodoblastus sp.]